ncbi:MAG: hypothetical protein RLZZ324_1300, partial [Candidatus Parcubacteria bacterium]
MSSFLKSLRTPSAKHAILALGFVLVVASLMLSHIDSIQAAISDGMAATDVLGQWDANFLNGVTVSYTKGGAFGLPTKTGINGPKGTAIDSVRHRMFVSDATQNRVLVFNLDTSDHLVDYEPDFILGQSDFNGVTAATTASGMSDPRDLLIVGNYLYVNDFGNHRVLTFDITTPANGQAAIHVLGQTDAATGAEVFTRGNSNDFYPYDSFNAPKDVALDTVHHRLFVADDGNTRVVVHQLSTSDTLVDLLPDAVLGKPSLYATTSGAASATSINTGVNGLAYDSVHDRLFVSEGNSHRVLVFDTATIVDGEAATGVLGQSNFTGTGSGTSATAFGLPVGLAYDGITDTLFVADVTNNRVLTFDVATVTNGEAATHVLGQIDFASSGSVRSATGMNQPNGVAIDTTHHRLFVAENGNARVSVFDTTSITDGMAAVNVLGQSCLTCVAAGPTQSILIGPYNVMYDLPHDRLFVSEPNANRVMVFDTATVVDGEAAVHVLGQADFTTATQSPGAANKISLPEGGAYDAVHDRLWVSADANNYVLQYDTATIVDGEAAVDIVTSPSPETLTASYSTVVYGRAKRTGLASVSGIAYDSVNHRLFVSDFGNSRVLEYGTDVSGVPLDVIPDAVLGSTKYEFTSSGDTTNQFSQGDGAYGIAVNAAGTRLFVADSGYNRVLVFDIAVITNGEAAVNVLGQIDLTGTGAATTATGMTQPHDVSVDATGNRAFVTDYGNTRVLTFDISSITNGQAAAHVLGQANFTSSAAATTISGLRQPNELTYVPSSAQLLVSDTGNGRVMFFDASTVVDGASAVNLAGQYDPGQPGLVPDYTIQQELPKQGLYAPAGIALDSVHHRLFDVDVSGKRIVEYDLSSSDALLDRTPDHILGEPDFKTISGGRTASLISGGYAIAYDAVHDRLFYGDYGANRVLVFDTATIVDGEAAVHVLGAADFTSAGSGALTATTFASPAGLAYDPTNDRLFVSSLTGGRVLVFDTATIVDGEAAVNVLGKPNFTSSATATDATHIAFATGLAYDDTHHRLFSADYVYNRVLVFDTTAISDGMAASHVLGQPNFTTAGASLTATGMSIPFGIAYDATNDRTFIGDYSYNRVLVFDTATIVDGEAAVHVLGQPNFTSAATAVTATGLAAPIGMSYVSAQDRVYVADSSHNRILAYDGGNPPTPPSSGGGAPPPDTTAPVISGVTVTASTTVNDGAIIAWQTDEASTSKIKYGLTNAYGTTWTDGAFIVMHGTHLTGLPDATTYHFSVCSQDSAANIGCSPDATFTTGSAVPATPPPDTTPPQQVANFTADWNGQFVSLNWTKPIDPDFAGTLIMRAVGAAPTTPSQGTQVYRSSGTFITDSAVSPGTTYGYAAFSYDLAGNFAAPRTAIVSIPSPTVPPVVTPPPVTPPVVTPPPVTPPVVTPPVVHPPKPPAATSAPSPVAGSAGSSSSTT